MDGVGLNQRQEMNPALLLSATVDSARPNAGSATPESTGNTKFDEKIKTAREQGRERYAAGLKKVADAIAELKKRIAALPGAIGRMAENAVMDAFTVPVRIENAIDTLNQKIADAKAAMERKVAEAKAQYEVRKKALLQTAQEVFREVQNGSNRFFGRIRETLFSSTRKREQEEFLKMMLTFLSEAERSGTPVTPEQFRAITEALVRIGERHKANASQLNSFLSEFFKNRNTARSEIVLAS